MLTLKVDYRRGSGEFLGPLRKMGVPVEEATLPAADFALYVKGPGGRFLKVGVERKTISEMLEARFENRFRGKQLPKLLGEKANGTRRYDIVILLVEGYRRVDPRTGSLMAGEYRKAGFGRAGHTFEAFTKFQLTLALKTGLVVWPSASFDESIHFLHALWRWGTKRWRDHKSAYAVESRGVDRVVLDERTMRRQTFAQWPGVGWERSWQVSKYFRSVEAAVLATEGDWRKALRIEKGTKVISELQAFLKGKDKEAKAR